MLRFHSRALVEADDNYWAEITYRWARERELEGKNVDESLEIRPQNDGIVNIQSFIISLLVS